MAKREYDSSLARMAGNIAAGLAPALLVDGDISDANRWHVAELAVALARRIVAILRDDAEKETA